MKSRFKIQLRSCFLCVITDALREMAAGGLSSLSFSSSSSAAAVITQAIRIQAADAIITAVADAKIKQKSRGEYFPGFFQFITYSEIVTTLFLRLVNTGCVSFITQSAVTVTFVILPSDGTVYIVFMRIVSRMERSPLAPVFCLIALLAISIRASCSISNSMSS
jgi:hypothetical protein